MKAVSELFAPVSGEVVEVNGELADKPELVNEAPYGKGWMVVIGPSDPNELDALLDAAGYEAHLAGLLIHALSRRAPCNACAAVNALAHSEA